MNKYISKTALNGAIAIGVVIFLTMGCSGLAKKLRSGSNTETDNSANSAPVKKPALEGKLFENSEGLHDFVNQLTAAVGSDNPKVMKLTFYDSYAMTEVQDPSKPDNIDGYTYRDGKLSKPSPVKILGNGKISDNVFPLKDVNIDGLPALTKEIMDKLKDVEGGHLTGYSVKRLLPFSKDIMILPLTNGTRKSVNSEADRNAKLKKFEVK